MASQFNTEAKQHFLKLLKEKQRRARLNKLATMFPDEGPLRRELYRKHMEFFEAGASNKERLLLAANRFGKSECGGFEVAVHATGLYPHWWKGHRFDYPVKCLAAGDTAQTTRDIIQEKLLGPFDDLGTGMIPGRLIKGATRKMGIADAYEEIKVKHVSGGTSRVWLRSYEQGRKVFQGFEQDLIWLDEEVPEEVYDEALIRTMTTNGLIMMTYTPIKGMTQLTMSFLKDAGIDQGSH